MYQIVITFRSSIDDDVKKDYLDWLEKDLINKLNNLMTCKFYNIGLTETDFSLDITVRFIDINPDEIIKFKSERWKIIEIGWCSNISEIPGLEEAINHNKNKK
jgi:hypothetical protein